MLGGWEREEGLNCSERDSEVENMLLRVASVGERLLPSQGKS